MNKINKWVKKLFSKKPILECIINDDLTALESVKVSMSETPVIDFTEVKDK